MKQKTIDRRKDEVLEILKKYNSFDTYYGKGLEVKLHHYRLQIIYPGTENNHISFWELQALDKHGYDTISIQNYTNPGFPEKSFVLEILLTKRKVKKLTDEQKPQVVTFASMIK